MPLPQTYSLDEVAESIGCSRWWLADAVRNRRVPHLRLSRTSIRFTDEDVQAVLDSVRQEVVVEPAHDWGLTPRSAAHLRRQRR